MDPLLGALSLGSSREPISVSADRLEFDYRTRVLTYKGGVKATQGDMQLQSNTLTVSLDDHGVPQEQQLYFAAFDAAGATKGAIDPVQTNGFVFANGTSIDSAGRRYVAGWYLGTPDFGDGPLPFSSQAGGFLLFRYAP